MPAVVTSLRSGTEPGRVSAVGGVELDVQPGKEDVEPLVEFGGAVVVGEDRGEAAEQGELAARKPMQAKAEQVVGLLRVDNEFL